MLRLFLRFLEAIGHKKLLVNWDGKIIAYRWYLFYLEDDEDRRLIARLPNIYIHENLLLDTPDGPDSHCHAWPTWSYMLRGGYWEEVDGKLRFNAQGTIAKLGRRQFHRITQCVPGPDGTTMTVFMHGFRNTNWSFRAAPCDKLCETCAEKYGRCVNTTKETPYEVHFGGRGKWRAVTWFHSKTPGLAGHIALRQRAAAYVRPLSRDEINARAAKEYLR